MMSKTVKLGFVLFILLIILSACREAREILPSAQPSIRSSILPVVNIPQPSTAEASIIPTVLPVDNTDQSLFGAYEGAWIDQEYNFKQCMFCYAGINIGFPENLEIARDTNEIYVNLTFYDGNNLARVVDAVTNVKLNQDGIGGFEIHEDSSGLAGKGEIRLQQDQIKFDLTLSGGPEKAKAVFNSERTFIRNPYQEVILEDPIELAKKSCGSCSKYIMKLDPGVEWHEDLLSGANLEVVNAWNQNEQIVRKFIVNSVKGTVREIPIKSEGYNTYWDSMAETTTILHGPGLLGNDVTLSLENIKAGLKFANPQIRWYCAYTILEAMDDSNRDKLAKLVAPLMEDADETVQKAAKFSYAYLTRAYDNDMFLKTKNNEKIVFYKYGEATYNYGKVWMIKNDKLKLLYKADGSINRLSLSKDGKWLVVENGGRIWSSLVIVDMQTEKPLKLDKLISAIMVNPINNYSKDDVTSLGAYCYFSLKQWSPDNKGFLFSYEINDINSNTLIGFAIYNITSGKIDRIIKSNDTNSIEVPTDFKW